MAPPAVPHPGLTPKAQQARLACMGTPLLLQQVTLVAAPAALNWQDGTKQTPWSWTKKQKPQGLMFQNDMME